MHLSYRACILSVLYMLHTCEYAGAGCPMKLIIKLHHNNVLPTTHVYVHMFGVP